MITYSFENREHTSLYEYLYTQIKNDILNHRLNPGEKLPSKRALAEHLNISTITVENAYSQLMAEGYIYSKPKSGFFVSHITPYEKFSTPADDSLFEKPDIKEKKTYFADFVSNSTAKQSFPFHMWAKLLRKTMSDNMENILYNSPSVGIWELRQEISKYLLQFRGMCVSPDQIVIGAGTEYLYSIIIQLLGRQKYYALEDPGYQKISKIYHANNVACVHIPMNKQGIDINALEQTQAEVVHISPSHHFPTGIVTPIGRRYELLSWADKSCSRYIIEDDYDSEFRFIGKPIPALQSIDTHEKVIYINTFSKSLSSTIRIGYMVLPKHLMKKYHEELNFYSCTVSTFEQYTLASFLSEGHFEKHINRMRNYYRSQRDLIMNCIKKHPNYYRVKIAEENSGLHFLLHVNTTLSDEQLRNKAEENGIHISCLSQYYQNPQKGPLPHTILINYSGIQSEKIPQAVEQLFSSLWEYKQQ